jgi:hypothetical protein
VPVHRLLLNRPFRAVAISFAVMAALFCVCAAFHPTDALPLLTWGLSYSLLLSLLAVGLVLASGGRLSNWLILSSLVLSLAMVSFWLSIRLDPSAEIFLGMLYGLCALLVINLGSGLVLSVWGWIRYFHWHRSARRGGGG